MPASAAVQIWLSGVLSATAVFLSALGARPEVTPAVFIVAAWLFARACRAL